MVATGFEVNNADQLDHGAAAVGLLGYLYVVLTVRLFARGSSESKPVHAEHRQQTGA